ncbi:MAG TPA: c-type cytochrome [Aestuariivirga sp.]|nr:c-type cytochrome [Aestuariivirga sp.]
MRLRSEIPTLFFCAIAASPAMCAEDAGAKLFKNHCGTCHSIDPAALPRQGPNLHGLLQRKAGTLEGYKYSAGLKAAGWQWTAEQLDLWLTDPKAMVPNTLMSVYKQKDPDKRKLIIDYLAATAGN